MTWADAYGAFTTWATYPTPTVAIIGAEHLSQYRTPNGIRHFCKRCGTHLYAADRRNEAVFGVLAGTIGANVPPPTAHYFVSDKASWYAISDTLPRFGGATGFEPLKS